MNISKGSSIGWVPFRGLARYSMKDWCSTYYCAVRTQTRGNSPCKMREFTGSNIFLFPLGLERVLKVQCECRNLRILGGSSRGSRHGWTISEDLSDLGTNIGKIEDTF